MAWRRRRVFAREGGSRGASLTGIILLLVLIGVGVIIFLLVR
jgi:hypothetical protein